MWLRWCIYFCEGKNGAGDDVTARQADERDKGVAFKNSAPFTNCISEINNSQVDNAKDIDIVMPMYNLIEYNYNHAKHLGLCRNITDMNLMII